MELSRGGRISFGLFELDPSTGELRKEGRKVRLQEKPLQLLFELVRRPGQVVTRRELERDLWQESPFLDFEAALNSSVRRLRRALGDSADAPRFIATVPRRGYQFIAPVATDGAIADEPRGRAGRRRRWRWASASLLAVTVGTAATAWWWSVATRPPSTEPVKLAILPFLNIDPDPEREFFTDGLTEELIAGVASIVPSRLGVIARTSAMRYKGTDKTVPEIGRELGVSHVLEGSARREGEWVRITAQLVRASDGMHLWARSYERPVGEVFAVQREIAELVARSLEIELLPESEGSSPWPAKTSPGAYEAYLKGNYFWNRLSAEDAEKSVESFEQATALDPAYAPAWAGLARAYHLQASGDYVPDGEGYPLSRQAALRALELDERLGVAHASLGFVAFLHDWDFLAAERHFQRALELDAGSSMVHHMYAIHLAAAGRMAEARAEMERTVALDPLSLLARTQLATLCQLTGDGEEAERQLQEAVELDPRSAYTKRAAAAFQWRRGQRNLAIAGFEGVWEQAPHPRVGLSLSWMYARTGRRAEARALLEEVTSGPGSEALSPAEVGAVHAALDEPEVARALLEKALAERDDRLAAWRWAILFSELRADPDFQYIEARLGLPPPHSSAD